MYLSELNEFFESSAGRRSTSADGTGRPKREDNATPSARSGASRRRRRPVDDADEQQQRAARQPQQALASSSSSAAAGGAAGAEISARAEQITQSPRCARAATASGGAANRAESQSYQYHR